MLNVKKAQSAFSEGRYADAGKYLGQDLHWMIDEIPDEALKIVAELEQFLEAFWKSAFDVELHLNGCTDGSEQAWNVIQTFISQVSSYNPIDIVSAIEYLVGEFSVFSNAFGSCYTSAKGFGEGVIQITWFEDAEGAVYYFEQALKDHPLGFMLNVKRAQSAFSEGRYADAGYYLGQDLHWMIDEIPDEIQPKF